MAVYVINSSSIRNIVMYSSSDRQSYKQCYNNSNKQTTHSVYVFSPSDVVSVCVLSFVFTAKPLTQRSPTVH
jgi:hypothetical protein